MARKYAWGDGRGRVHSRPKRTRSQLRAAVKAKRLDNDPLYDPTQQLSGSRLSKAADALVGLEFDPQRKALQAESAQAERQGGAVQDRASSYFMQLAEAERGNVERSQAIGGLLKDRLGRIGEESSHALDAAQQQAEGLGGGATRLTEELAAARARSAAGQQQAQTDAAGMTANYGNLADLSRKAREMQGGEVVGQLANRQSATLADIASRRAALEASVGPKKVEQVLGLRQSGFENAATAEGLGLDQAKLQAQVRQDIQDTSLAKAKLRATNRQNRARNRLTQAQIDATLSGQRISAYTQRRGQNISAEQRKLDRASRETIAKARRTGTKLESADAKRVKSGIVNALTDVNSRRPKDPAKWLRKNGAPGIVIKAALERREGGLKLSTVAELRRLGVRVPKSWIGAYKGPVAP